MGNQCQNAILLARVGKLFGKSPSDYLEIEDAYTRLAVDLACATVHWEDENRHYKESNNTANGEAAAIGNVLENYRKQLNERG